MSRDEKREQLRQYYKDLMRTILANVVRNHQHVLDDVLPYDVSDQRNKPWRQGITFIFKSATIREQAKHDGMLKQLEQELRADIATANADNHENRAIELDYLHWADMDAIKAAGGPRYYFQ
jgi:hypothetical protein